MAEISLLNPQNSKAVFKSLTKESINDLSLDFICKALTKSEYEQNVIKKWMLINAVDRAFEPCRECFIYIRDDAYIPANQIIRCEKMS